MARVQNPEAVRGWTCQRQADGVRCGHFNPSIKRNCQSCGKKRPARKRPAHLEALELDYEVFVAINGGELCKICGRKPSDGRRLDRDHDHRTGKPRGLLCFKCNKTLQSWMTKTWLEKAAAYLLLAEGKKACPRCGEVKDLEDFPKRGTQRNGQTRYGYCKPCHVSYQRERKLAREYGITVEEYDRMVEAQGGRCAICERPPGANRLAVDHDHATGHVRGLLCPSCNGVLGRWADEVDRFQRAAEYLERSSVTIRSP